MHATALSFQQILEKETGKLSGLIDKTDFFNRLLSGKLSKFDYLLFITNEYFIFHALEKYLKQHNVDKSLGKVVVPGMYRSSNIVADIVAISGIYPDEKLKVKTTEVIENRIAEIFNKNPVLLLAWAYRLYFNRLIKGDVISVILKTSYQFEDRFFSSFQFRNLSNPELSKKQFLHHLELAINTDKELLKQFLLEVNLSSILLTSLLMEMFSKKE